VLSDLDGDAVVFAAGAALAKFDVTAVRIGDVIDAGSSRSVVLRGHAERRSGEPLDVVIKVPTGSIDGFVHERAALSLVDEHGLPGVVRLLGSSWDPPLLVLEDLGDCRSVADVLLAGDPVRAERALVDWAIAVATLQASSVGLGDDFRTRLNATRRRHDPLAPSRGAGARGAAAADLLADWLIQTAETLAGLLRPLGPQPGPLALRELRALTPALDAAAPGEQGLVPGDTCPDNALYVDGQLTLIDFEAAAHRHVAWEAAYLFVPWPTCWCCWAIPSHTAERVLDAWRQTAASAIPAVTTDRFADHLARAVIAWAFLSMTFLLSRALADPEPDASPRPARGPPRPDARSLVLHRMQLAAAYPTSVLPALRDLAGQIHDACTARWGWHELQLVPAFRQNR
jgi:hypothetical protein